MSAYAVRLRDLIFPVLLLACGALGLAVVTRVGLQEPTRKAEGGRRPAARTAGQTGQTPPDAPEPRRGAGDDSGRRPTPRAQPPR